MLCNKYFWNTKKPTDSDSGDDGKRSSAIPPPKSSASDEAKEIDIEKVITIDPECYELDLNHGRIEQIRNFEPLVNIEKLYLRWNLIKKIENLQTLTTLVELELYDNQITQLEGLETLVNLE